MSVCCRMCIAVYRTTLFKKDNMMGKGEGGERAGSQVMEESDLGYLKPYGHPNTTELQQEKGGRAHFFPGME